MYDMLYSVETILFYEIKRSCKYIKIITNILLTLEQVNIHAKLYSELITNDLVQHCI